MDGMTSDYYCADQGQERAMPLINLSVMTHDENNGRTIFGVRQVQSDKLFAILVPYASILVDSYHRAQTLGAGTYVSAVAMVHSDDGQELAMKLFVNKEEEEERTPNVNIRALREIFVLRLLVHENSI